MSRQSLAGLVLHRNTPNRVEVRRRGMNAVSQRRFMQIRKMRIRTREISPTAANTRGINIINRDRRMLAATPAILAVRVITAAAANIMTSRFNRKVGRRADSIINRADNKVSSRVDKSKGRTKGRKPRRLRLRSS